MSMSGDVNALSNALSLNQSGEGKKNTFPDLKTVQEETHSDVLALLAKGAFMVSGVGTGVLAIVATGALIGLVGVAAATPVGWAALGALGVGLTILAIRHAYMGMQGNEAKTARALKESLACGVGAAVVTYLAPLILCSEFIHLAAGGHY